MPPKTRGARGVALPSTAPQTRRATRQTVTQDVLAAEQSNSQPVPGFGRKLPPVARRGAPKADARSVASISTKLGADSDDAEEEEEEEGEEADYSEGDEEAESEADGAEDIILAQPDEHLPQENDQQYGLEHVDEPEDPEAAQLTELMLATLPDLDYACKGVIELLKAPNPASKTYKVRLGFKRKALEDIRILFDEPDSDLAGFFDMATGERLSPAAEKIFLRANVATILEGIADESQQEDFRIADFLRALDAIFVPTFVNREESNTGSPLAIDIRTIYAIERLDASQARGSEIYEMFDEICAPFLEGDEPRDRNQPVPTGPFRALGTENTKLESDACAFRLKKMKGCLKGPKGTKAASVKKLREQFPRTGILEQLREWILAMYDVLEAAPGEPATQGLSLRAATEPARSSASVQDSESQPIVPASRSQNIPSLFENPESLMILNQLNHSNRRESSRPQPVAQSEAPSDYPEDSASQLLQDVPASSAPVVTHRQPHRRSRLSLDRLAERDGEEEDEDDDVFETDVRPPNTHKRTAPPSGQHSPPKRARHSAAGTISSARQPSGSMAPPPSLPATYPIFSSGAAPPASAATARHHPPPSFADFQAIAQRKQLMSSYQRLHGPTPAQRQRHPWSEHDCEVLIALIRDTGAKWADLEGNYKDRFEHPRNQQAYRDKARNMKVDFLLTDTILPPGFDSVMLGQKERVKVEGMGKNPFRRERDYRDGVAINTELFPQDDDF